MRKKRCWCAADAVMGDVEAAAVAVDVAVVQGATALAVVRAAVHAVASVRVSSRAFFRVRRVRVAFSRGISSWQRQQHNQSSGLACARLGLF
ncbi:MULTISPECIES: hypothetical protein [Brevibacillus]|uniref:hypothetical protein n=1 Tax=Brevibacillus sp. 1238 TaxID=2940565 RepID=UPI001F62299F|nr:MULTISPECIES: hypothetical protein [Brevibacillus]